MELFQLIIYGLGFHKVMEIVQEIYESFKKENDHE